jgi:hypothetical protein
MSNNNVAPKQPKPGTRTMTREFPRGGMVKSFGTWGSR